MKIIKLKNIDETAQIAGGIIKNGGVVIAPFDTVYGFICDPKNDQVLEKIFKLKGRNLNKTIGLAVDSLASLDKIAEVGNPEFIKTKIPGPFTSILKAKSKDLSSYCYKGGTVAIRIPDSSLVLKIANLAGGVIAQTSANKAGMGNCLSPEQIMKQFDNYELEEIDLIIDGGEITDGRPSEIWDLIGPQPKKIER